MNEIVLTAILTALTGVTCGVQLVTGAEKLEAVDRSKLAKRFRFMAAALFLLVAVSVVGGTYSERVKSLEDVRDDKIALAIAGGFFVSVLGCVGSAGMISASLAFGGKDLFRSQSPNLDRDQSLREIASSLNELVLLKTQEIEDKKGNDDE